MVLITASVFLFNILCNLVPCEPNFSTKPSPGENSGGKGSRLKTRSSINPNGPPLPYVTTTNGDIEGYFMRIINGQNIYAFEGIFYAEAPIGDRRFRNPVPKGRWEEPLMAKGPGPYCLQFNVLKIARITGTEDCLSLNVYTTVLPSDKNPSPNLPIFLWIHGGGGWFGAGSERGPAYLLQEDVVLVTVNYRLGILGFLSTLDEDSPGNYGLKDQALAIKWVSENARAFGGDPSKIILIGVSSGATFVHLHLMSPLTKHLIAGAVSLSGSAINHWTVGSFAKVERLKQRLSTAIDCTLDRGSRIFMQCARSIDPNFLVLAQRKLFDNFAFPPIIYHAVVEPPGPESFLTDYPENLYLRNAVANKPWIASQTTDEAESFAMAYTNTGLMHLLRKRWRDVLPDALDFRHVSQNVTETLDKIKNFYFPSEDLPSAQDLSEMTSDRYFRVGIHKSMQYHSRIAPTYGLRFGFRSEIGFTSIWGQDPLQHGVGHSADSGFYFNSSSLFKTLQIGTTSYDLSRMLINLMANFAHTGEPHLRYKNGNSARMWQPTTNPAEVKYLLVDNSNVVNIPEPRLPAIRFWENLGLSDTSSYAFSKNYNNYQNSNNNNMNQINQSQNIQNTNRIT